MTDDFVVGDDVILRYLGPRARKAGVGAFTLVRFFVCAVFALLFLSVAHKLLFEPKEGRTPDFVGFLVGVGLAALIVWLGIGSDLLRMHRARVAERVATTLARSTEASVPYARLGLGDDATAERALRVLLGGGFLRDAMLDARARAVVLPHILEAARRVVAYRCPACGGPSNVDPANVGYCPYCGTRVDITSQ